MCDSGDDAVTGDEDAAAAGATVDRLLVYPVKALDPEPVETAATDARTLEYDREYAIFDGDDEYVNGKREPAVHGLRSSFDVDEREITLRERGTEATHTFGLDAERGQLNAWLSDYFGYPVYVARGRGGGYPDDERAEGPTVLARESAREVASWFDAVDGAAEMVRRLRPNVVVAAGEPFWDDRLYGPSGERVRFAIGTATFAGTGPCRRCVVPRRDPETGEEIDGFAERFAKRRRATLPDWAPAGRFEDTYFRLMVNTTTVEGGSLSVGDAVAIDG